MIGGLDSGALAVIGVAMAGGYAALAFKEPAVFRTLGGVVPAAFAVMLGGVFIYYIAVQNTITAVNRAASYDVAENLRTAMEDQIPASSTVIILIAALAYSILIIIFFLVKEEAEKKAHASRASERQDKDPGE